MVSEVVSLGLRQRQTTDRPRRRASKSSEPGKHTGTISKSKLINEALANTDLDTLRRLAVSRGGFLNNGLRKRVWPTLLHCRRREPGIDPESDKQDHKIGSPGPPEPSSPDSTELPTPPSSPIKSTPRDASQVALDVNRSLAHLLPKAAVLDDDRLVEMRTELSGVILKVLSNHPYLHYYQGFHDVAAVLYLVLKPSRAAPCLESLALFFLRDFMTPTLTSAMAHIHLLAPLLHLVSPSISEFLGTMDSFLPYFCLSWVITWFTHDIDDLSRAARLMDFLLASGPLMPVYLTAAVVLSQREELVSSDPDPAMVHHFLARFPPHANLESLIGHAHQLYASYPPEVLQERAHLDLGLASVVNRFEEDVQDIPADIPLLQTIPLFEQSNSTDEAASQSDSIVLDDITAASQMGLAERLMIEHIADEARLVSDQASSNPHFATPSRPTSGPPRLKLVTPPRLAALLYSHRPSPQVQQAAMIGALAATGLLAAWYAYQLAGLLDMYLNV
ncbi:rab-GTPase-TBC domain-containing protein [Phlyctochytrium arcticum]|nr:rab-GTPase-TBC domain-containing protein [Phlyctochytrium arcticum]